MLDKGILSAGTIDDKDKIILKIRLIPRWRHFCNEIGIACFNDS